MKTKLPHELTNIALFVLDDMIEVMTSAINDADWVKEHKEGARMNRIEIKRYNDTARKIHSGRCLNKQDIGHLGEANKIHTNDVINLNGCHKEAMKLDEWLKGERNG